MQQESDQSELEDNDVDFLEAPLEATTVQQSGDEEDGRGIDDRASLPAMTENTALAEHSATNSLKVNASKEGDFWCTSDRECHGNDPWCNQGECVDLHDMRNHPPTQPGCWIQCPSVCRKHWRLNACRLWDRWNYGEQRGAKTDKNYCLKGPKSNNGFCGVNDIIGAYISQDGKDNGYSYDAPKHPPPAPPPPPKSKGSHVLAVDMPAKVETFAKTGAWMSMGFQPTWATKAAASKTHADVVYVAWTEQGSTGDGIPIHLSKLSIAGSGKVIKDLSYGGGYDRAGGIDTTPDGRVGFMIAKRMRQWMTVGARI